MMMCIEIKQVSTQEIKQLQQIGRQTFSETFSEGNTEANMASYLREAFSVEKLSAELKNSNSEFYFALRGEGIIGYLKLNFGQAQTELHTEKSLEIERIYVLKKFHGQQVGQLLYEKAVEIAKQKQAEYLWLGVWEKNARAIRFYEKNGFVPFDTHIFRMGDEEQTDILMKLRL